MLKMEERRNVAVQRSIYTKHVMQMLSDHWIRKYLTKITQSSIRQLVV